MLIKHYCFNNTKQSHLASSFGLTKTFFQFVKKIHPSFIQSEIVFKFGSETWMDNQKIRSDHR